MTSRNRELADIMSEAASASDGQVLTTNTNSLYWETAAPARLGVSLVVDAPVNQVAWAEYRQALRDVPDQEKFPYSVTWPVEPV